jgi:hypothetical protein
MRPAPIGCVNCPGARWALESLLDSEDERVKMAATLAILKAAHLSDVGAPSNYNGITGQD